MKYLRRSLTFSVSLMLCMYNSPCFASMEKICDSNLVQSSLLKITNSARTESLQCVARPFNYHSSSELMEVSKLICVNFVKRPEWNCMSKDIVALYSQANSPESLYETMSKSGTRGYVIEDKDMVLGVIILRPNQKDDIIHDLQIRRLHVSFAAINYKKIGTALLTIAATDAIVNNIPTLMTTASMPARGFFEKLGWRGQVIESYYSNAEQNITLPQFKCTHALPIDFQSF